MCVGSFYSPTDSIHAPSIAIDPRDDRRIAVAMDAASYAAPPSLDKGVRQHLRVAVSDDHGKTWTHSRPAGPAASRPGQVANAFNPQVVIDDQGAIHVVALSDTTYAFDATPCCYGSFFYVGSVDGGRTWTQPLILSDSTRVNNALRVYPGPNGTAMVLVSSADNADQDRTDVHQVRPNGSILSTATLETCAARPGPHALLTIWFFCRDYGRGTNHLWTLDMGSLSFANLGGAKEASGRVVASAAGVLYSLPANALASGTCGGSIHVSHDAGITWTPLVEDLQAAIHVEDAWRRCHVAAGEADAFGALHLVLASSGGEQIPQTPNGNGYWVSREEPIAHVVLSGSDGTLIQERRLTPLARAGSSLERQPVALYPYMGDGHDVDIAFGAALGFVAWWYERGIDYSVIQPVNT